MAKFTPMIEQYLQIKADYPDAFLFFRLGDFYELFFEDATRASKILEITLTSRQGGKNGEKIPMCGVPYHTSEPYIKKLIEKGYKVAICEQMEDPKQAQGVVKREVIRVVTPGTLMEENMLEEKENNYMIFICGRGADYAFVACDLSTGEVLGSEMPSVEHLLDEIKLFQAAEIVASTAINDQGKRKLRNTLLASLTFAEEDRASAEKFKEALQALLPDLQNPSDEVRSAEGQAFNSELIADTLLFMLQYIEATQKRSIRHLQPFRLYQPQLYLTLDEYSRRNLELTETIRERKRQGSLLWLLDETSTAMGGRLIKRWILRPLMNRADIEKRLDIVNVLVEHALEREEVSRYLEEVYDLERLAARVSFGNANPRDLLQLKKSLQVIPEIRQVLSAVAARPLAELVETLDGCESLVELLDMSISEDPPVSITEGGIFKAGYDAELDKLREASRDGKQWIADLEEKERRRTGIKSLKVGFNKVFGYYIEVTKANVHLVENDRYERKQTLANAERYITPELKEKEALILDASERSMELEYELFTSLREKVSTYTRRLQRLASTIAHIDCLCSFAKVSEMHHYTRPAFSHDKMVMLKNARHPVIEKVMEASQFVANDLMMDASDSDILLITGPNMAGKSTYMRQTALIAIMAQIGCFVPADQATLPIFDRIFTRIGAADDLVGGHSTFMVEMMETKRAITEATPDSLILLDEIGRGTSTYDGMSLAQAIIEYIHDRVRAKTLFSTHYHELTGLEERLPRLKNVHVACTEREGKVVFLHKVKEGKADRSYGIHVAQLAGMPDDLIHRARDILVALEGESPALTAEMEAREVNEARREAEAAYTESAATEKNEAHLKRQADENVQLSLFDNENDPAMGLAEHSTAPHDNACLQEIENLDIVNMTPLDALNTLFRLQQKIKSKRV